MMPHPILPSTIDNMIPHGLVERINIPTSEKSEPVPSLPTHFAAAPISKSAKSLVSSYIDPLYPSRVNITVSSRVQSRDKSPGREIHQKRLERELQSPSPEPIVDDSFIRKAERMTQTEEKFGMGSSVKSRGNE
jgi:hypothetical protein